MNNVFSHAKNALDMIRGNEPAALVMRHAERDKFTWGHHGNDVLLTEQGKEDAFQMGKLINGNISRLLHSPVERCAQTAHQLLKGSNADCDAEESLSLRCDAYVDDFQSACDQTLVRLVSEDGFYDKFVNEMSSNRSTPPYEFFKVPIVGTVDMLSDILGDVKSGLCIGITHDWLVNVAASHASGVIIERPQYADFLDALFLWRKTGQWYFYYKGNTGICSDHFSLHMQRIEN